MNEDEERRGEEYSALYFVASTLICWQSQFLGLALPAFTHQCLAKNKIILINKPTRYVGVAKFSVVSLS